MSERAPRAPGVEIWGAQGLSRVRALHTVYADSEPHTALISIYSEPRTAHTSHVAHSIASDGQSCFPAGLRGPVFLGFSLVLINSGIRPPHTGRFPCNSPKRKMVIASVTGVVEVMKKGLAPAVMSNARIVSLLREGQKLVFGDRDETAWRLMVLGGFISLDSGYAHDLPADLRREIVAVNEHFVEWCEITHERGPSRV